MNRSWIAKIGSRVLCPALVGTLVVTAWASLQAAPLVNVSVEGRIKGGDPAWLKTIPNVAAGDVIQYRVLVDMAPVGTVNTQPGSAATTIQTLTANLDGMNTLSLKVGQAASDSIQVDFRRGPIVVDPDTGEPVDTQQAAIVGAWKNGTGAFGGDLTPRGNGMNDLGKIRFVRSAGSFAGIDPVAIFGPPTTNPDNLAQFTVMTGGQLGTINVGWDLAAGTGGGRVNATDAGSPPFFVTAEALNSPDPIVGFSPLVLGAVPEPSTIALVASGLIGLVAFARRRRAA